MTDTAPARLLDLGAMLDAPETPIPWVVDRFAALGFLSLLVADGGVGKSWLAQFLAIGVAEGRTIGGIPCAKGTALILDGENGERLIARRYRAADGPRQGVVIYEAHTFDLANPSHATWLRDQVRETGATLVILDSLRSLAPRMEENNGDSGAPVMRNARKLARDTQAAVVVLHHRPKNGAAYRGHSVIRDQTDMLFVLGRESKDPDSTRRYLHADLALGGKMRIDAEPEWRWIHLRADGGRVTVDAAEPFGGAGADAAPTVREVIAGQVFGELSAIAPERLSAAEITRRVGRHQGDQTTRRALETLDERGDIDYDKAHGGWGVSHVDTLTSTLTDTQTGGGVSQTPIGGLTLDTPPGVDSTNGTAPHLVAVEVVP